MEALVFVFAGMIIEMSFEDEPLDRMHDLIFSFILFVLIYVFRALVICIHYPILRYFGYGLSVKEAVVVIISGTKGAVAIALALTAYKSTAIRFVIKRQILFHATTATALTIIFGSLFVKLLVKKFDLQSVN